MHTDLTSTHTNVTTLIAQAQACREGDYVAGLTLAEQAAARAVFPQEYCRVLALQGYFLLRLEKKSEARNKLTQGLELSRTVGDRATEAECVYRLGEEHALSEQFTAALKLFFEAEQLWKALEDRGQQADALNSIGTIYNKVDDYSQAIQYHYQAYQLREAVGDRKALACSLNNIGNAYGRMQDFDKAVTYFEKCLAASRSNGQERLEAMCLGNLSLSLSYLGRLPEAVEAGKAALALAKAQDSPEKQCYALLSIGAAYVKEGNHTEAIGWLSEAVVQGRASGSRRDECEAQSALGKSLLAAGRNGEAQTFLRQAEATAAEMGFSLMRAEALAGLSQICEHQGQMAEALAFYKEHYTLEKALTSEAADRRTKTLMIQMDVEKVQKEAQIHQLKNVELAALNAALEEANQTLQVQARELQAQAELLEAQGEELRAQAEELQRQATEDGLTGLANRRHLESWLAGQFDEAKRTSSSLSVAMADVDHFKQINDRFGHQIGDEVLMSLGRLLRGACRAGDLAARYGGEEFVLVLPQTDAVQAQAVCERLRHAVEKYPWRTIHSDLAVTISLGLSEDRLATSYERLLGQADAQLYAAKYDGRNRVQGGS